MSSDSFYFVYFIYVLDVRWVLKYIYKFVSRSSIIIEDLRGKKKSP